MHNSISRVASCFAAIIDNIDQRELQFEKHELGKDLEQARDFFDISSQIRKMTAAALNARQQMTN